MQCIEIHCTSSRCIALEGKEIDLVFDSGKKRRQEFGVYGSDVMDGVQSYYINSYFLHSLGVNGFDRSF